MKEEKRDRWERRPGIDLWSIPHGLFGVLMGTLPSLTGSGTLEIFAATALLAVLWEVGETLFRIEESNLNSAMDVVIALAAYGATAVLLTWYPLEHTTLAVTTVAILLVYLYTNISGWLAYRRRSKAFRR